MAKSPYSHEVTPIREVSEFFKYDDKTKSIVFAGDALEVRVSKRFEVYGLQDVSDTVYTLGIMDAIIDDKYQCAFNILAPITMAPSDMGEMVIEGVPYLTMFFKTGDQFITNSQVIKSPNVVYAVWVEFFTRGKPLYTMTYDELSQVFDRVREMTGTGIGVDRVIFELIVSHLSRNSDNLFEQYRYTDMDKPSKLINLRSVSFAPTSTSSRMIGSYFEDALTASLLHENTQRQPFEDLMRGLPPANQSGL